MYIMFGSRLHHKSKCITFGMRDFNYACSTCSPRLFETLNICQEFFFRILISLLRYSRPIANFNPSLFECPSFVYVIYWLYSVTRG